MGVGRARLVRNGLGSLAILAVVGTISVVLPAIDHALPGSRPVASGVPYPIGGGVSVVPPAGSMVDLTRTRPGVTQGTALFLVGAIRYLITVEPFVGNLAQAAHRLRAQITQPRGYQVTGRETPVRTASGLKGLQGGYTAPGRSGRYAVFVVDGLAIEVTVSGTDLELRATLEDIEASTRSIRYRSPQ